MRIPKDPVVLNNLKTCNPLYPHLLHMVQRSSNLVFLVSFNLVLWFISMSNIILYPKWKHVRDMNMNVDSMVGQHKLKHYIKAQT